MAYQIKLADASTYEIPELPVETVVTRKGESLKALKFYVPTDIASGGVEAVKDVFGNNEKTNIIDFWEDNRHVGREYIDFTLLYNISVDEDNQYMITMVKETDLPSKLVILEEQVAELTEQTTVTSETVATISEKIKDVDIDTLSIDELKAYKVAESKANLAEYLNTHSVTSTAHQGIPKEYSITSEKQGYLMSMVMMCQSISEIREKQIYTAYTTSFDDKENVSYEEYKAKVESGEIQLELATFQPSWNARGEECTYDWTLEELVILGADIEARVRPLVSLQQSMESQIMSALTKEEILAVTITFE